jgi:hypothetical protein
MIRMVLSAAALNRGGMHDADDGDAVAIVKRS